MSTIQTSLPMPVRSTSDDTPDTPDTRDIPDAGARLWPIRVALLITALHAGFFVAYQISVLRGLDLVDDVTYVTTFQAVNATIRSAEFAVIFFGAGPIILVALALTRGREPRTTAFMVGSFVCWMVVLGITFGGNIPLNNELALVTDLSASGAAAARAAFEDPWNRLNVMRTAVALLMPVLLVAAPRR